MTEDLTKNNVVPVVHGAFDMNEKDPHLIGTKCVKCGESFFPPRYICSYCLTDEYIEKSKLGNKGKLYVYTIINMASPEFSPPYAFGFVIIEPEMIRIPSLLTGISMNGPTLRSGTEMEMVIDTLREDNKGNEIVTYKFQPVSTI